MARKTCARLFVLTHLMKRLRKPLLREPWNKIISQHTRIQIFVCWDFNINWILSQLLIRFDWSQLSVTSASSQSAISILVTWQKWTNQRCILINFIGTTDLWHHQLNWKADWPIFVMWRKCWSLIGYCRKWPLLLLGSFLIHSGVSQANPCFIYIECSHKHQVVALQLSVTL